MFRRLAPQQSNYEAAPLNLNIATNPSPFEEVEVCKRCGKSYPTRLMYRLYKSALNVFSKAEPTPLCTKCVGEVRADWQTNQTFQPQELVMAGFLALLAGIGMSAFWALLSASTYQIAVFLILVVGFAEGRVVSMVLRRRKGPIPGLLTAVVMLVVLGFAFYFLYSALSSGNLLVDFGVFGDSLSKNGVPIITVLYFILAWVAAVSCTLELEPDIRDRQGNPLPH
jgi:hypothetical protein